MTAAVLAAQAGYLDILELLMKGGADLDTQSQVSWCLTLGVQREIRSELCIIYCFLFLKHIFIWV